MEDKYAFSIKNKEWAFTDGQTVKINSGKHEGNEATVYGDHAGSTDNLILLALRLPARKRTIYVYSDQVDLIEKGVES